MAKTTARSAKTNPRTRTAPPNGPVKVRMYRQGLGDCFLLTLPGRDGDPFYMMIDCGVLLGTEDAGAKMTGVVKDVIAATGGRLDVLVATHEHWDHVSGFIQAKDLFATGSTGDEDKLHVQSLWLAWTENPADPLARSLAAQRRQKVAALRATVQRLRAMNSAAADQVEDLLGFFGAGGGASTEDAMKAIRTYSATPPRFCRPSDPPIALPDVPNVRFYVLGPPLDEKLIKKSDPSKSHPEVYEDHAMALSLEGAFFAAALGAGDGDAARAFDAVRDLSYPFDRCYQVPEEQAKADRFFQRYYWGEDEDSKYKDQSWRQVGADWMNVASQFALQLDSDTNNTSLVLALELVASGKVLLFAADAQVGNWLSWGNLSWTVENGRGQTKVKAPDLLGRTVLYKVGHHGSHNATLRQQGLEEMASNDLIAMIPVNHAMAVKKRWDMPFHPLLERLIEKTSGRVLMIDDKQSVADRPAPDGTPRSLWKSFQEAVKNTDLYYELTIEG